MLCKIRFLVLICAAVLAAGTASLGFLFFFGPDSGRPASELADTDSILVVPCKDGNIGRLIDDQAKVQAFLDSIRLSPTVPMACGYDWKIYFLKNRRLQEDAFVQERDCGNFILSTGCFKLNRKFKEVLHLYTSHLREKAACNRIYDFIISAGVRETVAIKRLVEKGYKPFLLDGNVKRYPYAEILHTATSPILRTVIPNVLPELLTRRREDEYLARLIHTIDAKGILVGASEIRFESSSYGAGKIAETRSVTLVFKMGTMEETIRNNLPEPTVIRELAVPGFYPIQVILPEELRRARSLEIRSTLPMIQMIKEYQGE